MNNNPLIRFAFLIVSLVMIVGSVGAVSIEPLVLAGRNDISASFDGHNFSIVGSYGVNADGKLIHVIDHDRYVHFGNSGTVRSSQNGSSWDVIANIGTNHLFSGMYVRDIDTFVGVGTSGRVLTSVGIDNWTSPSTNTSAVIRDVTHNGTHFLMALNDEGLILASDDMTSFNIIDTGIPLALWSIAYRQSDGMYIVTADHNTVDNVYYGYNLEDLSPLSVGSTYGVLVRYFESIDSFVIGHNSRYVSVSSNGVDWELLDAMLGNTNIYDIEYSDRLARLYVSSSSGRVSYSDDLESFTLASIDQGYNAIRSLAVRDVPIISDIGIVSFDSFDEGYYSGVVSLSSNHYYFNTIDCVTSFDNGSSFVSTTQINDTHVYDSYNCVVDEVVSVVFSCSDDDFFSNVTTDPFIISCSEPEEESSEGGSVVVNVNFIDPGLVVFVLVAGLMIFLAIKIHPLFYAMTGMMLAISGLLVVLDPIIMAMLMIIGSLLIIVGVFLSLKE